MEPYRKVLLGKKRTFRFNSTYSRESDNGMIDMIQIMTLLMGFYVTLGGTIRDGKGLKKSKRKKRLEFILHVVFFFSLRD
jgi:hypothetical protein